MTGKTILKSIFTVSIFFILCGCRSPEPVEVDLPQSLQVPEFFVAAFSSDRDAKLRTCGSRTLIHKRFPPCSTFKIVATLMGLDCNVVHAPDSRLGYDGTRYENPNWNRDLTLQEAFQYSCVPYYKKLMGRLKKPYVRNILDKLDYGNCDLSVWNSNGHNVFWIESSLLISPQEQMEVLKKIFSGAAPFSPEHTAILKQCMYVQTAGQWAVYGKTGTGRNHNRNLLEAWFVGFAENGKGERLYFAAHGADSRRDVVSPEIREAVQKILETLP